ncbi:MAG: hypothetical protein JW955_23675 [Sedimentisphaerales bacterium]|nr:hypothetical protein [Sedimentisphaerales bacterium]
MNEGPVNHGNMIETTDCLEAIGVFRGWKNLFLAILLIGLLLVQAIFWLVDSDVMPAHEKAPAAVTAAALVEPNAVAQPAVPAPNEPNQEGGRTKAIFKAPGQFLQKMNADYLSHTLELINGIMIVATVLYTLTLFFSLMVSLVGRLGGIRHISRAFFLSVILLVLVIPWQTVVQSRLPGVVYNLSELLDWMAIKNESLLNTILYYLRFSGYWLVFLLLLIVSQTRSGRWTKSILRRLEII